MEELVWVPKIIEKYGVWAAIPLAIMYLLYRGGTALIPVWVDKIKAEGDAVRRRSELEIELLNKKHFAESEVIVNTGEAVRVAIPNAIKDLELTMSTGHQQVIAGNATVIAGQERIEKKIDSSHERIEKTIDRVLGKRVSSPANS